MVEYRTISSLYNTHNLGKPTVRIIIIVAYKNTQFYSIVFVVHKYTHYKWNFLNWFEIKYHCIPLGL